MGKAGQAGKDSDSSDEERKQEAARRKTLVEQQITNTISVGEFRRYVDDAADRELIEGIEEVDENEDGTPVPPTPSASKPATWE